MVVGGGVEQGCAVTGDQAMFVLAAFPSCEGQNRAILGPNGQASRGEERTPVELVGVSPGKTGDAKDNGGHNLQDLDTPSSTETRKG